MEIAVNPLLVECVLDKVFIHAFHPSFNTSSERARDAQNFRLVCKLWWERATHAYKKARAPVQFGVWINNRTEEELLETQMKNFISIMRNSDLIPVQSYILEQSIFTLPNKDLVPQFLQICAPSAAVLNVSVADFTTYHLIERSDFKLDLRKLETVDIQWDENLLLPELDSKDNYSVPSFLQELLQSSSALQKFSASSNIYRLNAEEVLCNLCNYIPKTVKIINLAERSLTDNCLTNLNKRSLKLEECYLTFIQVACSTETIRNFFAMQSTTLKILVLHGSSSSLIREGMSQLEELQKLELEGGNIASIPIPDTFPNLVKLNLEKVTSVSVCASMLACKRKLLSLRKLILPNGHAQAPLVRSAVECFPNLKSLSLSSPSDTEEVLREVFMYLPELEKLSVLFSNYLSEETIGEAVLSGICVEDCKQILKDGNLQNVDLKNLQRGPSILNLSKLKSLALASTFRTISFTDLSAHQLFLKMTTLKKLDINSTKMSLPVKALLRSKLERYNLQPDERDPPSYSGFYDGTLDAIQHRN